MNLRDKLRNPQEGTPPEIESSDFMLEDSAPEPKSRRTGGQKLGGALPKLDVNRRFLAIAGAAALMTALMAVMYLNNAGTGLTEGGTKIKVLAPKDDMPAGTRLTEDNTQVVEIPKAYLAKGYFTDLDKLKDHLAIAPMVAGEPILAIRISAPDAKYGIAYLLKAGERAKTITVDSASGLAGLIRPGNEVDLIATIHDPGNDGRRIGTPVLQKSRVIAVGSHLLGEIPKPQTDDNNNKSETGSGISSDNTVTLAIPAEKIGVVSLLEELGNLKMVLRAAGDASVVKPPFSDDVIMSLVSGKIPTKPVAPKPVVVPHVVSHAPVWHPTVVHHEVIVRHDPPPRPHPAPVHHDPAPKAVVKPHPPVHHDPPVENHVPQVIRFGGSSN